MLGNQSLKHFILYKWQYHSAIHRGNAEELLVRKIFSNLIHSLWQQFSEWKWSLLRLARISKRMESHSQFTIFCLETMGVTVGMEKTSTLERLRRSRILSWRKRWFTQHLLPYYVSVPKLTEILQEQFFGDVYKWKLTIYFNFNFAFYSRKISLLTGDMMIKWKKSFPGLWK